MLCVFLGVEGNESLHRQLPVAELVAAVPSVVQDLCNRFVVLDQLGREIAVLFVQLLQERRFVLLEYFAQLPVCQLLCV